MKLEMKRVLPEAMDRLRAEIGDAEVKVLNSLEVLREAQGELLDKEDMECFKKVRKAVKTLESSIKP